MEYRFDRAFYRIVYPLFLRPRILIGQVRHPVADLSEGGVRFLVESPAGFEVGRQLAGRLELPFDQAADVEGRVVRVQAPYVALQLSQGVPFAVMLDQQRFLQQRVLGLR